MTLVQVEQLVLSISILVILHEGGHFAAARLFKIRVEKFYLFFDPWFSLFKFKRGDTEYGIGWLPLGGYVKISGMIDESMDKEQMQKPPEPWEFRSKPTWQKLIVMVAGVTVNFFLGIFIYSMIMFGYGTETLPTKNVKYGIYCDSLAQKMGLQNGDKILSVDNKVIDNFNKIPITILTTNAHSIQVDRNGQQVNISLKEEDLGAMLADAKGLIQPRIPIAVDSVLAGSAAAKAGLKKGDVITKIDTTAVQYYQEITPVLAKFKDKDVQISYTSGTQAITQTVHIDKDGKFGFYNKQFTDFLQTEKKSYGFFESIPLGFHKAIESVTKQQRVIFKVKGASKHLGGFWSIGDAFAPVWDWQGFWLLTGFLSMFLAFVNILPIPALDGGHIMFLLIEMVMGRKLNEKFMEYAQYAGMIILFSLMIFANGNDVFRHFFK